MHLSLYASIYGESAGLIVYNAVTKGRFNAFLWTVINAKNNE